MTTIPRFSYAWEQFYLAVRGMAMSNQSVQERLGDAYRSHLMKIALGAGAERRIPPEIEDEFSRLESSMRAREGGPEGSIMASARALRAEEALELISSIVSMYDRLAKYGPNGK